MASNTGIDTQFGWATESTPGTRVVPTNFIEILNESIVAEKNRIERRGLGNGRRLNRGWEAGTSMVSGSVSFELSAETDLKGFHIYVAMPKIRFKDSDAEELVKNPEAVIERYYPEEYKIAKEKGMKFGPIVMWWDSSLAQKELGYDPKYNFEQEVRNAL